MKQILILNSDAQLKQVLVLGFFNRVFTVFFFISLSVHPFASEAEFKATVEIVRKFREGVGKELHQKLLQRAKERRNWVCS